MSIALVVTRGFGNGTFNGSVKDVVLAGYSIGIPVPPTPGDKFVQKMRGSMRRTMIKPIVVQAKKKPSEEGWLLFALSISRFYVNLSVNH